MSNQENKSDSRSSPDKGKAKSISNSAAALIRETLIPSNGTNTTTALSQQINNQKPQSSTSSAFLQEEEWKNKFSQQENVNTTIRSQEKNINGIDTDWQRWIPDLSESSSHKYPFHHHYHDENNSFNVENIKDGNEILDFLKLNNYTNEIYTEDLNQSISISNRQKDYNFLGNHKFDLEEFLETEDIQEYLLKISYTDDIYGIPVFLKELIIEARKELNDQNDDNNDNTLKHQKTAIERLKMVKNHLIEKRKLNKNNNNDDNEELLNNWLDKWDG